MTLLCSLALGMTPTVARAAGGTLLMSETFTGSSVGDPGFIPLNDACLTGTNDSPAPGDAQLEPCTDHQHGPVPTMGVTPGYLQLTDNENGKSGGLLYNRALPGNGGLEVTFEQYQYGGTAADGIAFFLVDGAAELTSTGAYGGGLGYTQRTGESEGVKMAYLGVGLDAYGNYAVDFEGRGDGCPDDEKPPAEYQVYDRPPNTVTLRGPGNGNEGYCYLAGTGTSEQVGTDPDGNKLYGSTLPALLDADTLAEAKRTVRVTVSPDVRPTVTVEIDFNDGNGFQEVLRTTMRQDAPRTYKFGWTASTGSSTDVHLIRNAELRSVDPLPELNLVKQVDRTEEQPEVYQIGDTVPYEFVVTNSSPAELENVAVTDPSISEISCPRSTLGAVGTVTASMTCTAKHVLTAADVQNGEFVNRARAAGFTGAGERVNSNESTVTVPVGGAVLQFDKHASTDRAAVGDRVAYTVTGHNAGNAQIVNGFLTDSLNQVLDDADVVVEPRATTGELTYDEPVLSWHGDLDPDETVTITYTVRIKAGGDGRLVNSVLSITPASVCMEPDGSCDTTVLVAAAGEGRLRLAKRADVRYTRPGRVVRYTVTATNTGTARLSGASFTDDLRDELDDARLLSRRADRGTLSYRKPVLTWRGDLAVGERATVTIAFRAKKSGDGRMRNTVAAAGSNCPRAKVCKAVVFKVPWDEKPVLRRRYAG